VSVAAAKRAKAPPVHWTDERLVSECLKGNQQAWSALLDKYKNLIFSIPVKLGLHEEASDIFQAVCLDLLTGLPNLREPRALPKWLMQTCYHKCMRHHRAAGKMVPLADETENLPADTQELPHDLVVQVEREQVLRDVIAELPPRCERMIRMLFFENPPRAYQTIAAELGVATGSIGFIRGRCLARLRKQLERKGF
jgi:RNA polymerase sigma factor (sigma-70 family)